MSRQTFEEMLVQDPGVAGTLFNTYTTSKTVIPATSLITLPANYWDIGKTIRFKVRGALSNIVTTPGTITFEVKIGSVVAYTTGAIQFNATAHTLLPFTLDIDLICRAIGSGTSANLMGMGVIQSFVITRTAGQTDDAQGHQMLQVPQTAPAVGTGFDSTVSAIMDFWAGFSISNAGNGVQIHQYLVESLN